MKSSLLLLCLILFSFVVRGQAVSWELSAQPGNQATNLADNQGSNFDNCVLSRGAGVTPTAGAGSMNSSGWFSGSAPTTLADAIAGNDYYEFTINTINCLFFNPTTIKIVLRSSATGPNTATLRCSSNGFSTDIGTVTVGTTSAEFTFSETVSPNSQTVTYRLYGYGDAAGGGTPGSGGTMRIGSSVVATDNDLQVFATTTFVTVTQVTNIVVNDGDFVPSIVFTGNVPGATFDWSRTPEAIGLGATSGMGNVPGFTASNNTGSPVISTFTVNATVGNCTGPDMIFTITVNPPVCTITVTFFGSPSACNDNGTPNDASDDFFTHNIGASFFNRPLTGDLQIVPGGDQIGTYSIPVTQIVGNQHIFNAVQLRADGTPTNVQMNFTDDPACIDAAVGPTVQSCSAGSSCEIIGFTFDNIGSCNNAGTPSDPSDDFFLVDVSVILSNSINNATLRISGTDVIGQNTIPAPVGTNITATLQDVALRADGQITDFTGDILLSNVPQCSMPGTGPAVNSCSTGGGDCMITDLNIINVESCDDNGTPTDPSDDFFIADVIVGFENPPATGALEIFNNDLVISPISVLVSNLSGNSHPFSNVQFNADGGTTNVGARFTADPNCVAAIGTTISVDPCSFPAPVLTCPSSITVSCANLVPAPNPSSVSVMHECPGNVTVIHLGDVTSNVTCINRLTITRTYQATDACGQTAICSQIITVRDQTPPVVICPAPITVSCAANVPAVDVSTLGVTDNCTGTAGISRSFLGEVISNQTCTNRFTITRTYQGGDACGNTATCIQVITVFDNTPPQMNCPSAVTVQCASQVPAVNIAAVTATDNCSGAATITHVSDVIVNQTCVNRFTVNRTFRAIDVCGNSSTCVQTIRVQDNTPPTLTCPAGVTVQCASLVPAVSTSSVVTSDNCGGGATVTHVSDVITNQTCLNRFILNRTYRSTDACGNSATCVQLITVFDNTRPVITFSDPLISGIPNGGRVDVQCFGQDPQWDIPTLNESSVNVTDNCSGNITVAFSQLLEDEGNCPVEGYINLYRLTWTATDACGNSSTAFLFLALVDHIPPVIHNVPGNITVNCDEIPPVPGNIFATDECIDAAIIHYSETDPAPGCQDGQVITRSWTAIDDCGNETVEEQNITLIDHKGPELLMQQQELVGLPDGTILNYTCNEGGIPEFFDELSGESIYSPSSCGTSGIISFQTDVRETDNCKFFGYMEQRTFHWKGVDDCGNETNLTIIARLIDDEAPLIIGVPDMTCIDDSSLDDIDAIDNCDHVFLRYWNVKIPNPCGNGTALRRTYEAYDECFNISRDTAILIPNDHNPPVMEFVNPVFADLEPGEALIIDCAAHDGQYTSFGVNDVSVEDECPGSVEVNFTEKRLKESNCTNGNVATLILEWTAIDICGNSSTLKVQAFIKDTSSPVLLNFRNELTIGCNDDLPEITAKDNCGDVSMSIEQSIIPGDCEFEYDVLRTITATDPCGNSTIESQTIHVGDGRGPIIEGVIPEICDDLSITGVTAFDPCAGRFVEVTMSEKVLETLCSEGQVIERIWSATDACDNVTQIKQLIVVGDKTSPEILIPSYSIIRRFIDNRDNLIFSSQTEVIDLLNSLDESSIFVQDECDEEIIPVFTLEIDYAEHCEDEGYFERRVYSWVATDVCGNSSSITFSVDIMDDVSPVLLGIPKDATIICSPLPTPPSVSSDDQAHPVNIVYTQSIDPGEGQGVFDVLRAWYGTDACGNSSTAVQHITWIPNTFLECDIVLPQLVECNSHGVVISANLSGGLGGYSYEWEVTGGGFIQSGQGTDEIRIYVGWSEVEINLKVTDGYGCTTSCYASIDCIDSALNPFAGVPQSMNPQTILYPGTVNIANVTDQDSPSDLKEFNLWPNPAMGNVNISFKCTDEKEFQLSLLNFFGQKTMSEVIRTQNGLNKYIMDVSKIPDGSYLMEIKTEKEIYLKVVVILHNE